jgi:hypothetical protein
MKRIFFLLFFLMSLPIFSFSQQIIYSDLVRQDNSDANFDIIGKIGDNIIVFKNAQSKYAVSVYDNTMQLKEKVDLDFMPDKAFNVSYVAYPGFFYLIYQYEKKSIDYCEAAKLDAEGNLVKGPLELDTTKIGFLDDNKIYGTAASEDKQHIMIYKSQKKSGQLNFATILVDTGFNVVKRSRGSLPYDDSRDIYNNFMLDNDANFIFTKSVKAGYRQNIYSISLIIKPFSADSFSERNIYLDNNYSDEVKLKIDNINKRYILNSFYYANGNANITGIFTDIWDKQGDSSFAKAFIPLNDSLRGIARTDVRKKAAIDNFFIRNIIVKKDGGFILTAEDFSAQANNINSWNRWDYLNNPTYLNSYNNYYYYPYNPYNPYYNMYGPLGVNRFIHYYYENILVASFDKNAKLEWNTIVNKDQSADNDDNYLSFLTFITGGEIKFLFNKLDHRDYQLNDNSITPDGEVKRNPPLKSLNDGYEFLPRFGKQVGARKIVLPCTYRNSICFAMIEY